MSTGSQVKIAAPAAHTPVAKTASQQPPSVGALEAPVLAEQMERARLGHNFGAISVFPPDPPIQPKRAMELGPRLSAFSPSGQSRANPAPVIPKGWAVLRRQPSVTNEAKAVAAPTISSTQQPVASEAQQDEEMQAKEQAGQPPSMMPDLRDQVQTTQGKGQPLPARTPQAAQALIHTEMAHTFGVPFDNVHLRTEESAVQLAAQSDARAYTDGREIGFAAGVFAPHTGEGRRTLLHEFAHVVQLRGGNTPAVLPPLATPDLAEWQAERAAATAGAGHAPRLSAYVGGRLFDKGKGANNLDIQTSNDEEALVTTLKMLDTLPDGEQRSGAISFLVGLAIKKGPVQTKATHKLIGLLAGVPNKNLGDHMAAIEELKVWTAKDVRAYDLLLYGRYWFADHSKNEIGSGLAVDAFRKYLHYDGGKWAIKFFEARINGDDKFKANLAARVVADLLEGENEPDEQKYRANYAALRAMARANGWESFGALGAASATPRVFSALAAVRQQAEKLERMVALAPVGDPWEDADRTRLNQFSTALDAKGLLSMVTPQGKSTRVYTAENREETEHALLSESSDVNSVYLQEMARAYMIAADAGVRLEAHVEVLHANALALDKFLGAEAARATDERLALFDLRHEYIETWLSISGATFSADSGGLAADYQSRLDLVERKFENFDQAVAQRKFKSARSHYQKYADLWNQGNQKYPGNDQLDEKFFFTMRSVLEHEKKSLDDGFSLGFSANMGGTIIRMPPSEDNIPTDLRRVATLDRDTSLFGLQSALFLIYATNLSVHNIMIKSDIGSSGFRAEQGARLVSMRVEMEQAWNKGDFDNFLKKVSSYEATLKSVLEKIKDRAKIDFLLNLAITLVAALVTEGAALVVRLGALSETIALARTARAISSVSTLAEIGVFTATQLSLEKLVFGKEISAAGVIKTAATNLAFLGALKAVGKLAEPLAQGSAVRQLLFGHLVGFTGVATVSATMTRIETGQWPSDIGLFLAQTATTYLLIAGLHHTFQELAAKPMLTKAAGARLENLSSANQTLAETLRARVDAGSLTKPDFEGLRAERMRLVEEARAVARVLRDANVISATDMTALNKIADNAVADARDATFPLAGTGAADPAVLALPAPETVIELTRVGESNTYVYDPTKVHTGMDAMLGRYKAKGFTVQGNEGLMRVVDPMGRTRFLLTTAPVTSTRLLLPPSSGTPVKMESALARATGLGEPQLSAARDTLVKINRDAELKLAAEYPDHTVVATLAMLIEQASIVAPNWPIDAVRGLADALALQRGIPRSALRRLFETVDPKTLPELFAAFHDIVNSPNVSSGSNYLIADDLLPKNSVKLIDAFRTLKKKGLELPAEMDLRAVRGLLRQIDKMPGGWLSWLSAIAKDKRAEQLGAVSGLTDPRVRLPANITELLATISADIPSQPGLNPLVGATGDAFVTLLESRASGKFSDPVLRLVYVNKVDRLRMDVAMLQQGRLARGEWENIVGRANEVRQTASILLSGATILVSDRDVGPKGQLPNVDLSAFSLPGGGKVINAPKEKNVHMDLLFKDASDRLVAMEMTTAALTLPEPWAALDPKNPAYGGDIDWSALDAKSASHRKFMQAVKIYQLNKMATALGSAWSGQSIDPASIRMRADAFSAPAARALENLGFQLDLSNGARITAGQIVFEQSIGPKKVAELHKVFGAAGAAKFVDEVGSDRAIQLVSAPTSISVAELKDLADKLGNDVLKNLAYTTTGLSGKDILDLVKSHGEAVVRWAGKNLQGNEAKALLVALNKDSAKHLQDLAADRAGTLVKELGLDLVNAVAPTIGGSRLATLQELLGTETAAAVMSEKVKKSKVADLVKYADNLEAAKKTELAAPTSLDASSLILDSNTLQAIKELLAGMSWTSLQPNKKAMINSLRKRAGLLPLTGDPAVRNLASIIGVHDLRAANIVLAESAPATGLTRSGVPITLSRDNAVYTGVLAELAKTPAVGGNKGAADRAAVADAVFAKTTDGKPATFMTGDVDVFVRLAEKFAPTGTIKQQQVAGKLESAANALVRDHGNTGFIASIPDGMGATHAVRILPVKDIVP